MEDINSESSSPEKENIEILSVETLDNSNKENFITDNIQLETTIEIEDTNSLKTLIVLITNSNKLHLQTNNLEERFTTL
ncbi:4706_t:CDS:2 [Scutellospora calospora]|uniref:4706_t:CDS:1 n=1 Tax=Scutellospora calospora TaxID=85575 RepID=A0ACA9K305_9GLOM|nr:4706_t:CDS:2 [Scutellospora calospora]